MGVHAYDHVMFRGVLVNRRTKRMVEWVEADCGITVLISQGSYRPPSSYSGSTHTGGGSIDVRCSHLTDRQRRRLVHSLKDCGFAAWFRRANGVWGPHIHCVALDDKEASYSARWQMGEYLAGRSGLVSGGADSTYRPKPQTRFAFRLNKPVPR